MTIEPVSFYKIRFSDCDMFGHLNNARYIDYLINAREDHLKEAYDIDLQDYMKQNLSWVVGRHEIVYLRPALYNEKVCITSRLLEAHEDALLVEMIMMNEARTQPKAVMWTNFLAINISTGKKERHPPEFMEFVRGIVVERVDVPRSINESISRRQHILKKDS